ncbi:hypothetical protein Dsin_002936 [Dipteronia sinensis]|uniref:Reverse transcriptase domain-containing protein n=1 Tax=Dipteronia sinensis TaxID=43782 RepID=A0AAE0ELQ0_9ROSI|nr:hypothetical protein Dsin_002936 [Dipteronia sinensis]
MKNWSFAEILKGEQNSKQGVEESKEERILTIPWHGQHSDKDWLRKCAVGELKEFSKITRVHDKLSSRGFPFSTSYLGGKMIIWSFDKECDREGFIKNKFFWEDTFSSMNVCSSSKSFLYHLQLYWVNIKGVPLRHWCSSFFKKLAWMLGEPLLIDTETLTIRRLDRGRVLVVMARNQPRRCRIQVKEEDQTLRKFKLFPNKETTESDSSKEVGEDSQLINSSFGKVLKTKATKSQTKELKYPSKKTCKRVQLFHKKSYVREDREILVANANHIKHIRVGDSRDMGRKSTKDKGKETWVRKPKPKAMCLPSIKAKLVLDKRSQLDKEDYNGDASSTSLDEEQTKGFFSNYCQSRGECSKKVSKSKKTDKITWALEYDNMEEEVGKIDGLDWDEMSISSPEGVKGSLKKRAHLDSKVQSRLNRHKSTLKENEPCGGSILNRGISVDVEGSAGVLITLWNEDQFKVKACISDKRCIILAREVVSLKEDTVFCNVYADRLEGVGKQLWNFIINAQMTFQWPWCIGGDFNSVLNPSERVRAVCNMGLMRNSNSFILSAKVLDLPLHGMSYTWKNSKDRAYWARLDRFLISPAMLSSFPKLEQRGLSRSLSDHHAIIIQEPKVDWGPCPFRFYNEWLEDENMMRDATKCWKECKANGSQGHILTAKVKASKLNLKKWHISKNMCNFSLKDKEERLTKIDKRAVLEGWTDFLRQERLKTMAEVWKCLRREEQMWRQKSRVKWLKDGDKNSKFFHSIANGRRRGNHIKDMSFNGEIRCDGNKAPGPDDLNLNFVKENWEVIQDDYMKFIQEFHKNGSVVKKINHTFIALIPKIPNLKAMGDYRPISLMGSMFKVVAKTLANRIKKVMDSVIGESQMTFVKGRGKDFGANGIHITHLRFSDDTIFFIKPVLDYLRNSKRILRCFELASGLKINFHNSCVVRLGKKVEVGHNWAAIFRWKNTTFPISYLGLTLGARPCSKSFWLTLVNKVKNWLAPWKRKFLSKSGRVVLIKSVLSSIPTYNMSVFKIPISIVNMIEKIQQSFLWGAEIEKRKLNAVD